MDVSWDEISDRLNITGLKNKRYIKEIPVSAPWSFAVAYLQREDGIFIYKKNDRLSSFPRKKMTFLSTNALLKRVNYSF